MARPGGRRPGTGARLAAIATVLAAALGGCATPVPPDSRPTPGGASAAQLIALANPGFESAGRGIGDNPEGWSTGQHAGPPAFAFTIDRAVKRSGSGSMRIQNLRPAVYGNIVQTLAATPYAGGTLRFSVWLRTQDVRGNAYGKGVTPTLQAMVSGSPAASADVDAASIAGTTEWVRRDVTLAIPRNADAIEVGVILTGVGTVWLDDALLEMLPVQR